MTQKRRTLKSDNPPNDYTWHNVTETDGGHGDETEVKGLEEGPVLPDGEDQGPDAEEEREEAKRQSRCHQVGREADGTGTATLVFALLPVLPAFAAFALGLLLVGQRLGILN